MTAQAGINISPPSKKEVGCYLLHQILDIVIARGLHRFFVIIWYYSKFSPSPVFFFFWVFHVKIPLFVIAFTRSFIYNSWCGEIPWEFSSTTCNLAFHLSCPRICIVLLCLSSLEIWANACQPNTRKCFVGNLLSRSYFLWNITLQRSQQREIN